MSLENTFRMCDIDTVFEVAACPVRTTNAIRRSVCNSGEEEINKYDIRHVKMISFMQLLLSFLYRVIEKDGRDFTPL